MEGFGDNLPGFNSNDSIVLKLYSNEVNAVLPAQITALNNQSLEYNAGYYSYVSLKAVAPATLLSGNQMTIQVYPNPFTDYVTFTCQLQVNSTVSLIIYDMLGRIISTPVSASLSPGNYQYIWKGTDASGAKLPGGLYRLFIQIG